MAMQQPHGCACTPIGVLKKSVSHVAAALGRCEPQSIRTPRPATALVALAFLATPAGSQPCTADVQCQSGRLSDNLCVGDSLVVKRRVCVGGRCQEREVRRENCRTSGSIDRCIGNVHEQDRGRCDALAGRCVQRLERQLCTKACSCRDKLLIIATGQCAPGIGCQRAIVKCEGECTCSPQPMCLDPAAGEN